MRILHISSAVNFGGGEKHLVDLCRGLQVNGNEVFVALRPTNKWQSRLDFLPPGNILHVSIRNSFGVFSARRISDFIRENEIEIVHAHVARDYIPASIACMASRCAKFVLTRHVMFPLKAFNRFALRNLTAAIAVSTGVERALGNIFPAEKVALIRNGIEIQSSATDEIRHRRKEFRTLHEIPLDVPFIGTVGELTPLKGQRDFVLAATEVTKAYPEARFLIVGLDNTIDNKFRRELKLLVKVFGIEDRFLWLDWVDDLPQLLAALDIYVSPSHSESFGLATLEAMASGTAVVATRTEGSLELFNDDKYLVPIGDPVALSKKISELLADAARRSRIAKDLQARAAENFSIERMISETEDLYRQILDGNAPTRS